MSDESGKKRTRRAISDASFYKRTLAILEEENLDESLTLSDYLDVLKERAIEEAVRR